MPVGAEERGDDFDAFYAATSHYVLLHVWATTGDRAAAEDAVAEAYLRAWQRWPRLRDGHDLPEAWVRRVAGRLAVSSWRKARNRLLAHHREAARPVSSPKGIGPEHVAVVDALRLLPPNQREAVVLHHLVDLPVEEVAHQMDAPEGTVKAWLSRGRRALADQLGAEDDEPVPPPPPPHRQRAGAR